MSATHLAIVIGVFLLILPVMIAVMTRMNRTAQQQIQRRRQAWKAAGGIGPCPGDFTSFWWLA
jgi:ABC-type tungstate transport system substrate-binding protein